MCVRVSCLLKSLLFSIMVKSCVAFNINKSEKSKSQIFHKFLPRLQNTNTFKAKGTLVL